MGVALLIPCLNGINQLGRCQRQGLRMRPQIGVYFGLVRRAMIECWMPGRPIGRPYTGNSYSMKTIGLLGGLSWESSAEYYRIINQEAQRRLGGVHSAECLLWSFDFDEIKVLQAAGDWAAATARMIEAARRLERGGAGPRTWRRRLPGHLLQYHA